MITVEDYFGTRINHPEATEPMKASARVLLAAVNALLAFAAAEGGYARPINPNTKTAVSGWSGDGGFRLADSVTGSPTSAHKRAPAIDIYDPDNQLDDWISKHDVDGGADNVVLRQFGLYREHPSATKGWCHLQTNRTRSGRRSFYP